MEIKYLGHSCFKITEKDFSMVCDPFSEEKVGLKMPKIEANMVTISHNHFDHNNAAAIKNPSLILDTPGEYELGGIKIKGIASFHDIQGGQERGQNTIFVFNIDGLTVCHLGDLGEILSSEQIEAIGNCDILMVPVGGFYTIGPKEAIEIISLLEPKIVIPMHFKSGKMQELEPLDSFLKEIGEEPEKVSRLKIIPRDLPEKIKIVVIEKE